VLSLDTLSQKTAVEYYNSGIKQRIKRSSNPVSAIKAFTKAIELDSNYYEAYFQRGLRWKHGNKDSTLAVQDFIKVKVLCTLIIENNPSDASAYTYRANAKYNTGDITGACLDYREGLKLGDNSMKLVEKKLCKF
jgi:tetratricopeptide (TPR) repeat protein